MLVVGPRGEWIKYGYDGGVYMIPEVDGIRIISNELCEFFQVRCERLDDNLDMRVQKVPKDTENVFKSGSTQPPAMLYDAVEHFDVCAMHLTLVG